MEKLIFKPFVDFEKEEVWVNKMSQVGWALENVTAGCFYSFAKCAPNKYVYRIELCNDRVSSRKGFEYVNFMAETGVEYISSYLNWAYFRRKTCDGNFDIYSDINSRIKHYNRIVKFQGTLSIIAFVMAIIEFIMYIPLTFDRGILIIPVIMLLISFLAGRSALNKLKKKAKLQKERLLREY